MYKNMTGERFGRLTVLSFDHVSSHRERYWKCLCDCGNEVVVRTSHLINGHSTSCGCSHFNRETLPKKYPRLYVTWKDMKTRCYNPNASNYERYGGRGITVCPDWHSFIPFCEWALDNGYRDDLTIDRKNNDKGYSPDNCRWVTVREQNLNRRKWKRKPPTEVTVLSAPSVKAHSDYIRHF